MSCLWAAFAKKYQESRQYTHPKGHNLAFSFGIADDSL